MQKNELLIDLGKFSSLSLHKSKTCLSLEIRYRGILTAQRQFSMEKMRTWRAVMTSMVPPAAAGAGAAAAGASSPSTSDMMAIGWLLNVGCP